jgi:hypothetical protein
MHMRCPVRLVAVLAVVMAPSIAHADSILFTGSGPGANGITLSASALFDISGTTLTITLSNMGDTSGANQDVPGNALTGLFFDLADGFTLTPGSASIAAGSLLQGQYCDVGPCTAATTNVGGEFRYKTGAFPGSADRGIASSGYVGGTPNFNGSNLDNPYSVDGVNFGIVAPVTFANPLLPNGGMQEPLIEGGVRFTLSIDGTRQLTAADLQSVSFQYGTNLSEARIAGSSGGEQPGVPEPSTALLVLSGIALAVRRARRARAAASRSPRRA